MSKKARKLHSQVHERHNVIELARGSGDARDRWQGMVIGVLIGFAPDGSPLVDFPGRPSDHAVEARRTAEVGASDVGREVTIMFADSDPYQPIVTGILQGPNAADRSVHRRLRVQVDAETIALTANRQLVLECGKCKITLTRDGRLKIEGAEILSRASGTQRIRGGSIQLN